MNHRATAMNKQTLLFDMDDTLIYCNKYFDAVLDQFNDLMTTWFKAFRVSAKDIKKVQNEYDIAGVEKNGFVSTHFPKSLVHTFKYFSDITGRTLTKVEEDQLWKLGMSVYEMEVEPYPGMMETLNQLRDAGHELFLYTGGEAVIQQRKIDQMKLEQYFGDRIFIRQHKSIDALEGILQQLKLDRTNTWMIGNSLRTDVLPALTNGIHAIYLKQRTEWSFNIVDLDVKPQGAFYTVEKLTEVPSKIHNWVTDARAHV